MLNNEEWLDTNVATDNCQAFIVARIENELRRGDLYAEQVILSSYIDHLCIEDAEPWSRLRPIGGYP